MDYHENYWEIRLKSFGISLMYPLAAGKLPQDLYVKVFTFYEMLRAADVFEDNNPKNKEELLRLHTKSLFSCKFDNDVNDALAKHASERQEKNAAKHYKTFFETYLKLPDSTKEIITSTTQAMIPGMIDASYNDIMTWKHQNEYAGYVAGEIGVGLTRLFAEHLDFDDLESMIRTGYQKGIALQKINILRDLKKDASFGKNYIPEELLKIHSLKKDDLFKAHKVDRDERFVSVISEKLKRQYDVVQALAVNAQSFLDDGLEYVLSIPVHDKRHPSYDYSRGIRVFTSSILLVAEAISHNIYRDPRLAEHKDGYKPIELLFHYGFMTPHIWNDDDKIRHEFRNNKIIK